MWSRPAAARLTAWGARVRTYAQPVPTPGRHVTAASALLPLVIPIGHRHRVHDHRGVHEVGAFLAGSHDATGIVEADGFVGVQVDLTPVAASRIVGDLDALVGTVVPLEDVLGPAGRRLVERVAETSAPRARLDLVESFLLDRHDRGREPDPLVAEVWRRVAAGATRVDDVVDGLGWSARTLRRRLGRTLGMGPKRLARVARFHRTLLRLEHDTSTPLARVAVEHGFADQAHLTNECRRLAGETPAALRARRQPVARVAGSSKTERARAS